MQLKELGNFYDKIIFYHFLDSNLEALVNQRYLIYGDTDLGKKLLESGQVR